MDSVDRWILITHRCVAAGSMSGVGASSPADLWAAEAGAGLGGERSFAGERGFGGGAEHSFGGGAEHSFSGGAERGYGGGGLQVGLQSKGGGGGGLQGGLGGGLQGAGGSGGFLISGAASGNALHKISSGAALRRVGSARCASCLNMTAAIYEGGLVSGSLCAANLWPAALFLNEHSVFDH